MKRNVFMLLCILAIGQARGQDTIYSIAYTGPQPVSTFEDRDAAHYFFMDPAQENNLWKIGTPSKTVFGSAFSAPLALLTDSLNPYPGENVSSFEFVIRTDDATFISFWHRLNTDSLADGGVVEVSMDGGSTWTNIVESTEFTLTNFYSGSSTLSSNNGQPGFTGNVDWVKSTIQGYALDFVRFRFTFTSDNSDSGRDGWMIDSFDFTCLGTDIQEGGRDASLRIFPNPTSGFVVVRFDDSMPLRTISVRDIFGRTVLTADRPDIDLSPFRAGLYFIEVATDRQKYAARVVRE